jgi:hypothetical protein
MIVPIIVTVVVAFVSYAEVPDVQAVGKEQPPRAVLSDLPQGRDFTKITPGASYKPGELLVRFVPRANGRQRSRADKGAVLAAMGGGNIKHSFGLVPGLTHVLLPKGLTVQQALKRFNRRSEILYAEPNYQVRTLVEPNDTWFIALWGMHNEGQSGGTVDADIDAPEAWDLETDANEIIVAVLDTGVDRSHVDLSANMWVNETELNGSTGVDDDNNGYVDDIYGWDFADEDADPTDYHGHGTHCSGTIGAVGDNNEGVVGVCWDVQIMALKIFPNYSQEEFVDKAISAIEYAVNNDADVLSNSWGGGGYSEGLKDAIEAADANGVLFIAAAGNDYGSNNDTFPHYPSSYDCNNIIAVMSTDHDDDMSSFSNYGPTSVDLGAPGSSIYSCKLGGGYTWGSGTSMATPHVAGACALVWAEHPTKSYLEVKELLMEMVDPTLPGWCVSGGRLNIHWALLDKNVINLTQEKGYDAIQDALDDANDLDIIRARPGTYYENIDFNGVSCTLTSIDPNDPCVVAVTIIDANGSGSVVGFKTSEDANSVLTGFTITGGSYTFGGGIHCPNASPTIRNCIIKDNYCAGGGGMYNSSGSPTLINCTFSDNEATMFGGGMATSLGSPTLINCTFTGNDANASGYGGQGGGICSSYGSPTLIECTFSDNSGKQGGGMYNWHSDPNVSNCTFSTNTATDEGGGMNNDSISSPVVTNCVFTGNTSLDGGAMSNRGSFSTVINCTFCGNDANDDGGAMFNIGASATIINSIFWDDQADGDGDEIYNDDSDPNFSYCDIEGCGGSGGGWDPNFGTDDGNNIDADPCFVDPNDPNGPDDIWCTIDDGLQLGAASPCIDAANNDAITVSTDIAGSVRKRDDPCRNYLR